MLASMHYAVRRGAPFIILAWFVVAGCNSGSEGSGGADASDTSNAAAQNGGMETTSTQAGADSPCCPDPGQLGYNPAGHCAFDGEVCPFLWLDTGAAGGGIVTCEGGAWHPDECPWRGTYGDAECPEERSDLGSCEPAWDGVRCPCLCEADLGGCSQSASCVDGRWIVGAVEVTPENPCPVP